MMKKPNKLYISYLSHNDEVGEMNAVRDLILSHSVNVTKNVAALRGVFETDIATSDGVVIVIPSYFVDRWKVDKGSLPVKMQDEIRVAIRMEKPLYLAYRPQWNSRNLMIYNAEVIKDTIRGIGQTGDKVFGEDEHSFTMGANPCSELVHTNSQSTVMEVPMESENTLLLLYV